MCVFKQMCRKIKVESNSPDRENDMGKGHKCMSSSDSCQSQGWAGAHGTWGEIARKDCHDKRRSLCHSKDFYLHHTDSGMLLQSLKRGEI